MFERVVLMAAFAGPEAPGVVAVTDGCLMFDRVVLIAAFAGAEVCGVVAVTDGCLMFERVVLMAAAFASAIAASITIAPQSDAPARSLDMCPPKVASLLRKPFEKLMQEAKIT
jgi:hypothetical protein